MILVSNTDSFLVIDKTENGFREVVSAGTKHKIQSCRDLLQKTYLFILEQYDNIKINKFIEQGISAYNLGKVKVFCTPFNTEADVLFDYVVSKYNLFGYFEVTAKEIWDS